MTSPPSPHEVVADHSTVYLKTRIAAIIADVDSAVQKRETQLPALLAEAKAAGVGVPELADLTGYTRQYIYRLLAEHGPAEPRPENPESF